MMNFKEFSERMESDMKNVLAKSFPGTDVQRREIEKMQSQSYTALTISPENSNIGANVNLNCLYGQMEAGASYDEVMEAAVDQSQDFLENIPQFGVASLSNYDQSKSKLFVEVVSAELKPVQVESLAKIIAELTGMPEKMLAESAPDVFVVSNEDRMKGAGTLFYPDMMDQIADKIEGDFFVLPSSVHEVLIMPDTGMESAEDLKAMVTSINGDVVEPEDVLTDQVYHYDAKDRVFELGEKFEARKAEKELSGNDRGSVLQALKDKQKEVQLPKITKEAKNRSDMEL